VCGPADGRSVLGVENLKWRGLRSATEPTWIKREDRERQRSLQEEVQHSALLVRTCRFVGERRLLLEALAW
jgi:hypothetical protein